MGAIGFFRKCHGGSRRLRWCVGIVLVVLTPCAAAESFAQGSEPRLLIPTPGGGSPSQSTVPSASPVPTPPAVPGPALSQAGNPAAARLEIRMTQLEQDVRAVTGRLEEVSYQLRKLDERLTKVTSDLEYRLGQMKATVEPPQGGPSAGPAATGALAAGGGAVVSTPRAPGQSSSSDEASPGRANPGSAPSSQTASLPPRTPREQYARAFSLMEKRNYEEAGAAFGDFLKAYPNDALAENARYWLGETHYARGDYARSAELFLEGYEKNKTGPKAADTLLKLGLSLSALDKKKEACATFRELTKVFPNASEGVKDKAAQESKRLGCT